MAVTMVDETHRLNEAVDYTVKGKPHHDNEYIQGKRALEINSINASCNPKDFKFETHSFLKHNVKNRKGTYTGIRTIISFDPKELNYQNLKDRHTALAIGTRVARRKYPHNQSLIVLQADNKHHILHDHIITCARRLDNGLSSSSGATFKNTVPYTDEALKHYGLKPLQTGYQPKEPTNHAVYGLQKRGKYSYVQDLHDKIHTAMESPSSIDMNSFENNLAQFNIACKPLEKMRKNKQTGKYEYHFYKHPTNSGIYNKITESYMKQLYEIDPKIAKNSNLKVHMGQYLRDKKHITFLFKDNNGKVRVVRDTKLGKMVNFKSIKKQLAINYNHMGHVHVSQIPSKVNKPINHKSIKRNRPSNPIKSLGITKSKHTFDEYIYGVDTDIHINGVHKPYLHTAHIPEPVMKFHPKSHDLAKAINDLTSALNKIKNATQNGSDKQKELIDQAYEDSLLRKKQAQKVNEINNENRAINQKVYRDNQDIKADYINQKKQYYAEIQRERYQQFHR